VLAHQPRDPAPTDLDTAAFERARNAFGPIGRARPVDLHDPREQFPLADPTLTAADLGPDPGMAAAVVGHQDPAQPTDGEPSAQAADEREAPARASTVNQRFRGLAQDPPLHAQALDLAPLLAQFGT
jgi:hypothetical protein